MNFPLAGIATFRLAETFKTTIGLDPSEGMISTARALASEKQSSGGPVVRFEVSTAEDISPELIPDGSVDLITAATCAHVSLKPLIHPLPTFISRMQEIAQSHNEAFDSCPLLKTINLSEVQNVCASLITSTSGSTSTSSTKPPHASSPPPAPSPSSPPAPASTPPPPTHPP